MYSLCKSGVLLQENNSCYYPYDFFFLYHNTVNDYVFQLIKPCIILYCITV